MIWKEKKKPTNVKLYEDLHTTVKSAAPTRSQTVEAAYQEALEDWLVKVGKIPPNEGNGPRRIPSGGAVAIPLEFRKKLGDARVQAQELAAKLDALEKHANASGSDHAVGAAQIITAKAKKS